MDTFVLYIHKVYMSTIDGWFPRTNIKTTLHLSLKAFTHGITHAQRSTPRLSACTHAVADVIIGPLRPRSRVWRNFRCLPRRTYIQSDA